MRNSGVWLLSVGTLLACAAVTWAADRPLREARSKNERFVLRIEPGQPGRAGRDCRGELSESPERGRTGRRVWERALVNDAAPTQVYIRDDGRFVVTLDEYRRGGARNALVVYGEHGEFLRHFLLTDLLEKEDWKHVVVEKREIAWLRDARCAFEPNADRFTVEFSWGHQICIDLKTLQVIRTGTDDTGKLTVVPVDVLALLFGTDAAGERGQAERVAGMAGLTPEEQAQADAIAGQLIAEPPSTQAAAPPAAAGAADETPSAPAVDTHGTGQRRMADRAGTEASPARDTSTGEQATAPTPSLSPNEIAVPAPNPAEKVDYVAWLNEMGQPLGPDANPVYQAAIAQSVRCELDSKLLTAAVRGDPAALASPEVAAWVAANAGALAKFREASEYGGKGWSYHSPDGSLIGIVLPELASLRTLARASVIDGRRLAASGQSAQAAERYLDTFAAGAHAGSGMTIIEGLVGAAMQGPAADAYLDLQADTPTGTLDYADLAARAEAVYLSPRPLSETVLGERAMFMDAAQRLWDVDPTTGAHVLNVAKAREMVSAVSDLKEAEVAGFVSQLETIGFQATVTEGDLYYDALGAALAQPYQESVAELGQLESILGSTDTTNPFLRTVTPSFARAHFVETRAETTRRAALLVTNLNAYRQQHGEYPSSLDAFADRPFVVDPFSNARFVYRRVGHDFKLYSVGGNGADDAGVHDQKGETNDVVFWPRPRQ